MSAPEMSPTFLRRLSEMDRCDGYLVVVMDPETDEVDAYGPFDGLAAIRRADRFRAEFDRADLTDVRITITRLHQTDQPADQVA